MRRGTTPTHQFVLPYSVDLIDAVEITYCQNNNEIIKKYTYDCEFDNKTVSVTLSQDDTFEFIENVNVEIQIRILTIGGDVHASNVFTVGCKKSLSSEVLI